MADKQKLHEIMSAFERAFYKAREHLFKKISERPFKTEALRRGDFFCKLDGDVYSIYRKVAEKYKMLVFCEEDCTQKEIMDLYDYKYLLILDPIDGTVNMFSNLPFGVNIALGSISPQQRTFKIGNIECVFIADYLTKKTFKWINGERPEIIPPQFDGKAFQKNKKEKAFIYEIPDESSYLEKDNQSVKMRQVKLLEVFRNIFPKVQRRAIDCTGLRIAEIADGNIVAYGDLREAGRIWDTVPSIKFLLETGQDYHILDADIKPYSNDSIIMESGTNGYTQVNNSLGKGIVVIGDRDYKKIQQHFFSKKVFIVHGRDKSMANSVARFIEKRFGLKCTILDEEVNSGKTIIEKLEKYASAEYAVVLLTPDDEGRLAESRDELKRRARQNVIFEMGLFYGLLHRSRVIVLHREPLELPSDIEGILYVPIDGGSGWKHKLFEEISSLTRGFY
jgi:fructose-1,6-bisphosphatase/inositol monophosphatase family enzyme